MFMFVFITLFLLPYVGRLGSEPRDDMHSADYAVTRCLSVCLSVRHTPVFCRNGYTYPRIFFHRRV